MTTASTRKARMRIPTKAPTPGPLFLQAEALAVVLPMRGHLCCSGSDTTFAPFLSPQAGWRESAPVKRRFVVLCWSLISQKPVYLVLKIENLEKEGPDVRERYRSFQVPIPVIIQNPSDIKALHE